MEMKLASAWRWAKRIKKLESLWRKVHAHKGSREPASASPWRWTHARKGSNDHRTKQAHPWPLWIAVAGVGVIAVIGVGCAVVFHRRKKDSLVQAVPNTRFGRAFIYDIDGPDGSPVRVLMVGGVYQSGAYLDEERKYDAPFAFLRSFDVVFHAGLPIGRALMLGGGAYAIPKHLISRYPDLTMDVVEIDPSVTELARSQFGLDDLLREYGADRLSIIHADASDYLRSTDVTYDALFNDLFAGRNPNSFFLSEEGLALIHDHLNPQGIYATNVVAEESVEGADFLMGVVDRLHRIFEHVHIVPCFEEDFTEEDNYLVIGTDGEYDFQGEMPAFVADDV